MHTTSTFRSCLRHPVLAFATAASLSLFALPAFAQMGGGGGQQGSSTPPAASASLRKTSDRDDPIEFLLTRKKLLELAKTQEDSLKAFKKEMRRMQDLAYKDLDKAATRKEQGQLPGAAMILSLTKDAEARVKDVQSAYRDRARGILRDKQKVQVDSLEGVWKRTNAPPPPPATR
ncbi:MAG: hypothetical protein ACO1Q7_13960 [Gemmatimonas sp.]